MLMRVGVGVFFFLQYCLMCGLYKETMLVVRLAANFLCIAAQWVTIFSIVSKKVGFDFIAVWAIWGVAE